MFSKRFVKGCSILLGVSMLTGCGGYSEVSELNNLQALNSESSVSDGYNLSYTDEQEMIYAQVADRALLDLSSLDACTDNELQQVINYMDNVDNQLIGAVSKEDGVIDSCFTDYLLSEFEKTPYYWQREKTTVRGIDASSRSIIVDVSYKTIDHAKDVKPDSTIVMGEPSYREKLKTRHDRYISILNTKFTNPSDTSLQMRIDSFKQAYGEPSDIYESQRNLSLTDYALETGNQRTYNGMIDSEAEKSGGTMTVRYVLVPNYVLGINLGITCKHMYVTDFKLSKDCTEGLELFKNEGYATVTDSVYDLIYRYFTCIDESNYAGLYKLSDNFGSLDKYYEDMFDNTYRKHDNFSVSLFDITGTHIKCGVSISSKVRAKGSNMTYPSYTDRYYVELELIDSDLKVENMVLLSRNIEGEPVIATDEADTTGFTAKIDLNNEDKVSIENLICEFGSLQLLNDTKSDKFSEVVDLSMTTSELSELQENMSSLTGVKKAVWLQNYQQGTSNYASVKCRELFQDDKNSIIEAVTTYDFILKGGKWYVYGYDINSSVRLDTTNLATTGSLCLVSAGKIESYTSQLKGTASTSLDDVSDTSVTYEHKEYTPVKRSGTVEQGLNKISGADVTEEVYNNVNPGGVSYQDCVAMLNNMTSEWSHDTAVLDNYKSTLLESIAVLYNRNTNRYSDEEWASIRTSTREKVNNARKELAVLQDSSSSTLSNNIKTAVEQLSSLNNRFN